MKCSCPNCSNLIEVDAPGNPEKGSFIQCPECNAKFWRHLENFSLRAFKKDWKIFCAQCGEEIGLDHYCKGCGAYYPEYWVVQKDQAPKHKPIGPAFSLDISFSSTKASKTAFVLPDIPKPTFKDDSYEGSSPFLKVVVGLVVILALVGFGVKTYMAHKAEQTFIKAYVKTLFGIRAATTANQRLINKRLENAGDLLSNTEQAKMKRINGKIEALLAQLEPTPDDFEAATTELKNLFREYQSLHQITVSNSVFQDDILTVLRERDEAIKQSAAKVKSSLPREIVEEINSVTNKYTNLKYFGAG